MSLPTHYQLILAFLQSQLFTILHDNSMRSVLECIYSQIQITYRVEINLVFDSISRAEKQKKDVMLLRLLRSIKENRTWLDGPVPLRLKIQ